MFKDSSGSYYTWSRVVIVFFPFYVSGRGSGGDGASGGGLVVDDVLIGGDGWWLEYSKSITRENRERLTPRRRVICFYFCVFF